MKRMLSCLLVVLLSLACVQGLATAENAVPSETSTLSVFSGITWGDDIEYVKSVIGYAKSQSIPGSVVTYLQFETSFANETASVNMYFVENKLSKILFLFILPDDGFDEELLTEIENELGEYTLTEDAAKQWSLQDGSIVEFTSDRNRVSLTFNYPVELLLDNAYVITDTESGVPVED